VNDPVDFALHQLPFAIRLSRSTPQVIRQIVAVSLIVKAVVLALTVARVTNLWLAVAADMGTPLLVTFIALRPLRFGKDGR
jgi:Cd2+/Zn2+-exporting ATPase